MIELLKKFWDWRVMPPKGTYEEQEEWKRKNEKKTGCPWPLREDAPAEAVEAYEEYCRIKKKATEQGIIID